MKIIYAPDKIILSPTQKTVFLAGSIENGKAENWQDKIIQSFENQDITFLNPRRLVWNPDMKQSIDNPIFVQQVVWELNALQQADLIVMYLQPNTYSPISLLEFGLYAQSQKLVVCCPEGFWRKGNIDVTSKYYNVLQVLDLQGLINQIQKIVVNSQT